MGKAMSLDDLAKYMGQTVDKVRAARKELAEVQVGFNSKYVERKAEHDATLERLVQGIVLRFDEVDPDLRSRIEVLSPEERQIATGRYQALEQKLVQEAQAQADQVLKEGQAIIEQLRGANPRLDQREEQLKQRRAELEGELQELNQQIKQLSGCLVVFNYFKINRLDRQRQRVIGQIKEVQQELKVVREEWHTLQQEKLGQQQALQAQWQRLTLQVAELQAERDYLSEEANRDDLALRRTVRRVVDALKEPIPCSVPELKAQLDTMVQLNIQTDDYEAGLAAVAGLLALLDGVAEGLKRFAESVAGLIEEQRMHSAYLPRLRIELPNGVLRFHTQWDRLAAKVRDDARLSAHPTEFMAAVQPTIESELTEAGIKAMFEGMGQALKQATKSWKG
ncbi:MAG: hypothetical protein GX601_08520 [Anaerolineales bacterium]|nr:hypothetical protein [Anaerolineales bacterium]